MNGKFANLIGRLLGAGGVLLAAVYIATAVAAVVACLAAAVFWIGRMVGSPRSTIMILAIVMMIGFVTSLYMPTFVEIPMLPRIEAPDIGGENWNAAAMWAPLAVVILSWPLALGPIHALQVGGLLVAHRVNKTVVLIVLLASSALPLLLAIPPLLWVGIFGLPGAVEPPLSADQVIGFYLLSPGGFAEALSEGWLTVMPVLATGSYWAFTVWALVICALVAWITVNTFLLRRWANEPSPGPVEPIELFDPLGSD